MHLRVEPLVCLSSRWYNDSEVDELWVNWEYSRYQPLPHAPQTCLKK